MPAWGWRVVYDGKTPPQGQVVRPNERLSWPRTIGLGLCPKFGALVYSIPGGVLGGITLVLYGMIGLLGAKIWVENGVDFGDPINLVPIAASLIAGIGDVTLKITDSFQIAGIALGTLMVIVYFHLVRFLRDRMGTYDEPSDRQPVSEGAGGEPTGREVGDRDS